MKRSQIGFAHLFYVLFALVIMAAVGLVGWRVLQKSSPDKNQTSQTTTSNPPATSTTNINGNIYQGDITQKLTLQTIKLTGTGQQGIAVDPNTGDVYVGTYSGINNKCIAGNPNQGQSYLSVVDPAAKKEVAAVATDQAPIWPAIDDQRGLVYVAASSGSVAVHRLGTGEKIGSIQVGGLPHMPALLGNTMIVSNTYNQSESYYSVINLDTRQVIGNYQGPHLPHPIVIDPTHQLAYMMGVESGDVGVIDMKTGQLQSTFNLSGGSGQLSISFKYNKIITSSSAAGASAAVFDLSTKKNLGTINFQGVGTPGTVSTIDDTDGLAFIVMSDQNAIGIISLNTLKPLGYFKVGGCPYAVRLDTQREKGFVSNSGEGTLSEFDINNLKAALR